MPSTASGSSAFGRPLPWEKTVFPLRVIAGTARGRPLVGPASTRTRPTSDKVKGALFSMLDTLLASHRPGSDTGPAEGVPGDPAIWQGVNVADFYAGTGALGIEALSRGAGWCDFFETDSSARRVIARNLQETALEGHARIVGLDVRKVGGMKGRDSLHVPYGLVLMDPPYDDPTVTTVLEVVVNGELLDANALVAIEHSRRLPLGAAYEAVLGPKDGPDTSTRLVQVRERRHGDTVLSIFRWGRRADRGEVDADYGDLSG